MHAVDALMTMNYKLLLWWSVVVWEGRFGVGNANEMAAVARALPVGMSWSWSWSVVAVRWVYPFSSFIFLGGRIAINGYDVVILWWFLVVTHHRRGVPPFYCVSESHLHGR